MMSPERNDLAAVKVSLTAGGLAESARPALSLVAGVVEEQWPHQAPQRSLLLSSSQRRHVVDEGLQRLDDVAAEARDLRVLGWPGGLDPGVQLGELFAELHCLLPLVRSELRLHERGEEQRVLARDVGPRNGRRPRVMGRRLILGRRNDDGLLVGLLKGGVARAGVGVKALGVVMLPLLRDEARRPRGARALVAGDRVAAVPATNRFRSSWPRLMVWPVPVRLLLTPTSSCYSSRDFL